MERDEEYLRTGMFCYPKELTDASTSLVVNERLITKVYFPDGGNPGRVRGSKLRENDRAPVGQAAVVSLVIRHRAIGAAKRGPLTKKQDEVKTILHRMLTEWRSRRRFHEIFF